MQPTMVVTSDMLGVERKSLSEITAELAEFSCTDLLIFLVKLVNLLGHPEEGPKVQLFAQAEFFSPADRAAIERWQRANRASVVCLSRQQLLCALKFALTSPSDSGRRTLARVEDRHAFGRLLAGVQQLYPEDPPPSRFAIDYDLLQGRHRFPAQMLSRWLLENPWHFGALFARMYEVLFEHLPAELEKKGLSRSYLDDLFFEQFGIPFEDCFLFVLLISLWTHDYKLEQIDLGLPGVRMGDLAKVVTWDKGALEKLIALFSSTRQELTERVTDQQAMAFEYDFEVFRDWPILRVGGDLDVIDTELLIHCVGDRLLNRLLAVLPVRPKGLLNDCLGRAFEAFCVSCIASIRVGAHQTQPLTTGSKVVDIEVQAGRARIFIEICKSNWMSPTRYSGDPEKLAVALKRLNREVKQLAFAIAKYIEDGFGDTVEIIPLLVGMDRSLGFYFVQYSVDKLYQQALERALKGAATPRFIRRLTVMNADDYQSVCELVRGGRELRDLFHALYAEDPEGFLNVSTVFTKRGYAVELTEPFNVAWKGVRERVRRILKPSAIEEQDLGEHAFR